MVGIQLLRLAYKVTPGPVITVGYELVPSLQPEFEPNSTALSLSHSARLPQFLRRSVPLCESHDIGKGDSFRLTPSLFEYKVLSSWRTNSNRTRPEDEGRVEYKGGSFHKCSVYEILFDHSTTHRTQTITVSEFYHVQTQPQLIYTLQRPRLCVPNTL
jgi:hypothetical protein